MNEEKAKTKWCPMMRYLEDDSGSNYESCKCIASECMMWVPEETKLIVNDEGRNETRTFGGHCGLVK